MPKKAAWLEFETNPELEFEFFLAQKLGKTVADLGSMSNDEYMRWAIFYGRKRQREQLAQQMAG